MAGVLGFDDGVFAPGRSACCQGMAAARLSGTIGAVKWEACIAGGSSGHSGVSVPVTDPLGPAHLDAYINTSEPSYKHYVRRQKFCFIICVIYFASIGQKAINFQTSRFVTTRRPVWADSRPAFPVVRSVACAPDPGSDIKYKPKQ